MYDFNFSNIKEVKLKTIFKKVNSKNVNKKARELPTTKSKEYNIPLLTCQNTNNGFARYGKKEFCHNVLKNVISIAGNGSAIAFYQPEEFAILQDAYAIELIDKDLNENTGIFFAAAINKMLKENNYCWTNKAGWNKIKEQVISVPITENEEIDWNSIEEAVVNFKKLIVDELKKEHKEKIQNMMKNEGLNTFEVSEEERLLISADCNNKEFFLKDLFYAVNGDTDIKAGDINNKGDFVLSSGITNNGVVGKTDKPAKLIKEKSITVDMFGNSFYRDFCYKMVTHARIFALIPKFSITENIGLYINHQLKFITKEFSFANMCSWNKIKDLKITLPSKNDAPDLEYIEKYIFVMKKITISEIVKTDEENLQKLKAMVQRV